MNNDFQEYLKRCAESMFEEMADSFQSQIVDEVREYPRQTIRQEGVGVTGKQAGSPRDVVDTGALRDSYNVEIASEQDKTTATFEWTADHAALVYSGAQLPSGTEIPPYPWVHNALNSMDMEELVKNNFVKD